MPFASRGHRSPTRPAPLAAVIVATGAIALALSPAAVRADTENLDTASFAENTGTDAAAPVPDSTNHLSVAAIAAARRADSAVRTGDFTAASRQYALAAEASPGDPALRLELGVALSASGHSSLAVAQFRRAIQISGGDVVARLLLQESLAESGDSAGAQDAGRDVYRLFGRKNKPGLDASVSVANLNSTLSELPNSPVLLLLLGDAWQLSESWPEADSAYAAARKSAPHWSKPLVNGGLSLLAQGKTGDAIKAFTEAIRLDPANAQAEVWKGEAELRAGQNYQAIDTLQRVASRTAVAGQLREQANTSLGMAFASAGSYSQAIEALNTAQKLAPTDPAAAAALGQVKLQAGDFKGAASAYDTALDLTRGGGLFAARPVLFRALAEAQLSDRSPAAAIVTLRRAMKEEPASAALWHRLVSQALFDLGQDDEATAELRTALDLEPGRYPVETLNVLGARNLIAKVQDQYQQELDLARANNQSAPEALTRPLIALASLARYGGKIPDEIGLRRELADRRGTAADWYMLAETYDLRASQPQNARDAYLKALEISAAQSTASPAPRTGTLTEAQTAWSRKRLAAITASSFRP